MSGTIFKKDGTAQGVAKQRYIESLAKPSKRIVFDPYAERFVIGARVMKLLGHKFSVWISKKIAPGFHEHIISRTRFLDDLVKKSIKKEIEQYVILGAGYDSRAHRLNLPSTLKIFEVDQPEVQKIKRSKLPFNTNNSKNVTYVRVDFNRQALGEELLRAGFDKDTPTIFTLEGVSQYITKEALASTLTELSELTKNTNAIFFMSYVDKKLQTNPSACFGEGYHNPDKKAKIIQDLSAKVGEPWISFYSSQEIVDILSQHGFKVTENKTLAHLNTLYFTPVNRTIDENEIFKLEHFLVAKSNKLLANKT